MDSKIDAVRARLTELAEPDFAAFQAKLIPTVEPGRILGVRTPALRALAKELRRQGTAEQFLNALPHFYLEENSLHAFLLNEEKDFSVLLPHVEAFLPALDNWAVCDGLAPRAFRREPEAVFGRVRAWLADEREYTVRFGLVTLLRFYLDENFRPEGLKLAAALTREEYYIRMANAWYFSVALVKQYEAALPYLTERRLDPWTHNKAIQKAIESFRIPEDRKAALKALRR